MNGVIKIIKRFKKYILLEFLLIFVPLVYADTNTEFNDKIFKEYFEDLDYKITENECLAISEYDKECKIISAIKIKGSTNKSVDLYIFNDNVQSKNYFDYVYNDSLDYFKNTITYNLNNEDNSNYSYVKTELSGLYNFYLVRFNNYVIKSNIEINKHKTMDKIYNDLGLIKDSTMVNNYYGIYLNLSIVSIISIILDIILIIIFVLTILKIKDYKKRKKFLIIEFSLIIIVGIFSFLNLTEILVPDSKKIKLEYESLNNKKTDDNLTYPESSITLPNKIKYVSSESLLQILNNNKKIVVFIGYPKCLYCRSAIGTFIETSNKVNIDKVYYLDITKEDKNSDAYKEILKILGYNSKDNIEIYTPTVVFMEGKGIVFQNKDTIEKHYDPYQMFTKQFKEGLEEIYLYGFKLLNYK